MENVDYTDHPMLQTVPGDHLFLFAGSTATAAHVLAGRGQEVETVVLESLIHQGEQHLERKRSSYDTKTLIKCLKKDNSITSGSVAKSVQTLAKNLISWS